MEDLETRETDRMIASDKVEGTAVFGPDGERLGHIARFMVDKVSGQAEYAVLAYGGLFGLGNRHYPLPWNVLTYDTDKGGYVVNITREQLDEAPSYESEDEQPVYDRDYGERVYAYYGITYM